jgi:hypothetical protein
MLFFAFFAMLLSLLFFATQKMQFDGEAKKAKMQGKAVEKQAKQIRSIFLLYTPGFYF